MERLRETRIAAMRSRADIVEAALGESDRAHAESLMASVAASAAAAPRNAQAWANRPECARMTTSTNAAF
jgi:hypothetical protein